MRAVHAILAVLVAVAGVVRPVESQEPAVHAVLFYSPTCPHCHEVINRDLPPLRERYGDAFVIVGVDVSNPRGQELYQATVAYFALPESRVGVPTLVVGLTVLVGSLEIPEQLPGIIERGLASGGIDWPPVDAVRQVLAQQGLLRPAPQPPGDSAAPLPDAPPVTRAEGRPATPADASPAADTVTTREEPASPAEAPAAMEPPVATPLSADSALPLPATSAWDRFLQDPVGNGVAVAVLLALLAVLVLSTRAALGGAHLSVTFPGFVFPALVLVGMGIAAYLSFVEVTGATAVCGPVGDCNTVQQSSWARLFGVLPVGILGLVGYLALGGAWAWSRRAAGGAALHARVAVWGMAWMGTAFSAYLTFLEPFVIGATCAWCVSSAVVMALLLLDATARLEAPPAP